MNKQNKQYPIIPVGAPTALVALEIAVDTSNKALERLGRAIVLCDARVGGGHRTVSEVGHGISAHLVVEIDEKKLHKFREILGWSLQNVTSLQKGCRKHLAGSDPLPAERIPESAGGSDLSLPQSPPTDLG
jgi:hypothetical protein